MATQKFKLLYVRSSGIYVTRQGWQFGFTCLILLLAGLIGFLVSRSY
ncbi:hypothetical protein BH10CHL1_BH10CHL1_27000 [soil metagenome]